jgi:hypothetical protein
VRRCPRDYDSMGLVGPGAYRELRWAQRLAAAFGGRKERSASDDSHGVGDDSAGPIPVHYGPLHRPDLRAHRVRGEQQIFVVVDGCSYPDGRMGRGVHRRVCFRGRQGQPHSRLRSCSSGWLLKSVRFGSPSSLREQPATAYQSSRTGMAGNAATLAGCGELWAAVTGREPNGIQEVGSSTLLGSTHTISRSSTAPTQPRQRRESLIFRCLGR